jgi:uncharacterized protein
MSVSGPVLPSLVENTAGRFASALRAHFGERLHGLRLFGSYARGTAHELSDVDVFVLLDRATRTDRLAIFDVVGDLWNDTGLRLSPTIMEEETYEVFRRQERPLIMEIEREGIGL